MRATPLPSTFRLLRSQLLAHSHSSSVRYLEDIIGTNIYVEKIEAAGKVVEELQEKRVEFVNRVRAVEKEKDSLEGAKSEAEEFIALEVQITDKRSMQLQYALHWCLVPP